MSEVKINTNNTNEVTKQTRVELAKNEQPDIRDVDNFQALLSERIEGDQKKDSKRNPKDDKTDPREPGENTSILTLLFGEKTKDISMETEAASDWKNVKVEADEVDAFAENVETLGPKDVKVEADEVDAFAENVETLNQKDVKVWTNKTVISAENIKADPTQTATSFDRKNVKVEADKTVASAEDVKADPTQTATSFDRKNVKVEADRTVASAEKKETAESEKTEIVKETPINIPFGEKILTTLGQISDTKAIVPAETISKIGYEIAERIMIEQSINAARQEAVIVFKENVLAGTQVSVLRKGSELSLTFTTFNAQSLELLTAGHDGLRNFLIDQLKDITAVHIKLEGRESSNLSEKNQQRRQQNQQSQEENNENTPQE